VVFYSVWVWVICFNCMWYFSVTPSTHSCWHLKVSQGPHHFWFSIQSTFVVLR
jgi:hypothetical protein